MERGKEGKMKEGENSFDKNSLLPTDLVDKFTNCPFLVAQMTLQYTVPLDCYMYINCKFSQRPCTRDVNVSFFL